MASGYLKGGYIYVLIAGCLWGTTGAFAKLVYAMRVDALQLAFLRPFIAWVVIGAALAFTNKGFCRIKLRDIPLLIILGLTNITAFSLAYFYAIQLSSITQAVFLLYTGPIFAVVLARLFLGEMLLPTKVISLVASITGMVLLTGMYRPSELTLSLPALATGLAAAISYAFSRVLGKVALKRYPLWTVVFYSLTGGTFFLVFATQPHRFLFTIGAGTWLVLVAMSLVTGVAAMAFAYKGLQRVEASRATIVSTIEPVVASALGFFIFGETLTPSGFAGAGLILLGAILVQF